MSRGTDLAMYLETPLLAGMDGYQRLDALPSDESPLLEGLSVGEWAFLTCCEALHNIESNSYMFDKEHRRLLCAALDGLTLTVEDTL